LIRKQRELDDAKREMDLTIQKQVQAELGAVRDQAKQETEAALTLRVREKEEQIASMQRQIEDLKRKAEQGSQQLQGEVQELEIFHAAELRGQRGDPKNRLSTNIPRTEFVQNANSPHTRCSRISMLMQRKAPPWLGGATRRTREDRCFALS
jgi:hypothetical protein